MQQPSQRDVSWRLTEVATQLLVGRQLRSELLDPTLHPVIGSAALTRLLQRTPEQTAAQRLYGMSPRPKCRSAEMTSSSMARAERL
jgi:hypothetical protein